jgi:hypothetical protein
MVENAQGKAFKEMGAGNAVQKRYSSMKNKSSTMKETYREKLEYLQQKEKLQDNDHKEIIEMEEKWRKLAALLRDINKVDQFINEQSPVINENEIDCLKRECEDLENVLAKDRLKYDKNLKKYEGNIERETKETAILTFKLKEKDREWKLSEMKINEFKRGIPRKTRLDLNTGRKSMSDLKLTKSTYKNKNSSLTGFQSTSILFLLIYSCYSEKQGCS